jgi:hydroxymethylpyrimidine/phosphomethylpyrimidine kinase
MLIIYRNFANRGTDTRMRILANANTMTNNNIILTITGSDSTGAAGVQADIRTIAALGGRPVSAITSITVQNTVGIQQFYDLPGSIVAGQIEAIMNDVQPSAVKVGMVRRSDVLDELCRLLLRYHPQHLVFHPVVRSSRGERLMDEDLALRIRNQLLPLCSVIVMRRRDNQWLLCQESDPRVVFLDDRPSLHGHDNMLSTALATLLSQGVPMKEALERATAFTRQQVSRSDSLQGRSQQLYNEFLDQVDQHLLRRSDVQYYADLLNVSSRYLAQVTRRVANHSPKAIIDNRMAEYIRLQLNNTQQTVQQIAFTCGFSSQAHLSRFFRKMTGTSPSEYRANIKSTAHTITEKQQGNY